MALPPGRLTPLATPDAPSNPSDPSDDDGREPRSMSAALRAFLREEEWEYGQEGGPGPIHLGYGGNNGAFRCVALADDGQCLCRFYSILPLPVPAEQLARVQEVVTRINFDLPIGNFEMDADGGEVRFKTAIDLEGADPSTALIRQLVASNVNGMDRYLPAFKMVLNEGVEPREAVRRVEG